MPTHANKTRTVTGDVKITEQGWRDVGNCTYPEQLCQLINPSCERLQSTHRHAYGIRDGRGRGAGYCASHRAPSLMHICGTLKHTCITNVLNSTLHALAPTLQLVDYPSRTETHGRNIPCTNSSRVRAPAIRKLRHVILSAPSLEAARP